MPTGRAPSLRGVRVPSCRRDADPCARRGGAWGGRRIRAVARFPPATTSSPSSTRRKARGPSRPQHEGLSRTRPGSNGQPPSPTAGWARPYRVDAPWAGSARRYIPAGTAISRSDGHGPMAERRGRSPRQHPGHGWALLAGLHQQRRALRRPCPWLAHDVTRRRHAARGGVQPVRRGVSHVMAVEAEVAPIPRRRDEAGGSSLPTSGAVVLDVLAPRAEARTRAARPTACPKEGQPRRHCEFHVKRSGGTCRNRVGASWNADGGGFYGRRDVLPDLRHPVLGKHVRLCCGAARCRGVQGPAWTALRGFTWNR